MLLSEELSTHIDITTPILCTHFILYNGWSVGQNSYAVLSYYFQHTFCKSCVEERVNEICPIDHKPSKYIVDNIALREQIGELIIHCKYGCKKGPNGGYIVNEEGCPVTVKIADRYNHEKDCDFSLVQCPNNNACKPCLKKVSSLLGDV